MFFCGPLWQRVGGPDGDPDKGGAVKIRFLLIVTLVLTFAVPAIAGKKKPPEKVMIEKMEAVPCGAKEKGLNGLGSVFASAGIEHVNSEEKLCPQYMLISDEMEYHIRPLDKKHPVILPVGQEGEFRIDKDRLYLKVSDGDRKTRPYQVVAMKPTGGDQDKATAKPVNPPQPTDPRQ
jgi:hypothetical protein